MPPRTPGVGLTNIVETRDPLPTDDEATALDVGSRWINTVNGTVWHCVDNSVGAAVWKRTHPVTLSTVDPTTSDDSNSGYLAGDHWINTAASPRRAFTLVNAAVGAAVWIQTTNTVDNTDSPGLYLLGSVLDYSISSNLTANEVQYSRVFLLAGLSIQAIQVFVDSGGTVNRSIRVGLYDQVVPTAINGIPNARVAQSALTPTDTANGTYFSVPLLAPYVVPTSGFYWIAIVVDSTSLKLITTPSVYRQDYPPVRRELLPNANLLAVAGTLTNPSSAIAFAAATE